MKAVDLELSLVGERAVEMGDNSVAYWELCWADERAVRTVE